MRCIHYEACSGKLSSIRNGSSVNVYDAVSATCCCFILFPKCNMLITLTVKYIIFKCLKTVGSDFRITRSLTIVCIILVIESNFGFVSADLVRAHFCLNT